MNIPFLLCAAAAQILPAILGGMAYFAWRMGDKRRAWLWGIVAPLPFIAFVFALPYF